METVDFYLPVPNFGLKQRRSSDGYLNTKDMLSTFKRPGGRGGGGQREDDEEKEEELEEELEEEEEDDEEEDDEEIDLSDLKRRRGTTSSLFDAPLLNIFRKNYGFASTFAEIDDQHQQSLKRGRGGGGGGGGRGGGGVGSGGEAREAKKNKLMVRGGPAPLNRAASPRPLRLQQHHTTSSSNTKWRNDESTSISSADSALDDLNNHAAAASQSSAAASSSSSSRNATWQWLRIETKRLVDDVIDAFETGAPIEERSTISNEKLSAVALRKDLKRFYAAVQPYLEVGAALYDMIMWRNPLSTLLLVLVIIYSLFRGWLASLFFGLLLFQLSINYLSSVKKIDIGWMFIPRKAVTLPKFDISGAQLIFDIARLAQKLLRFGTNILEKIESLMMWKNVKVSKVFYTLVIYWMMWTLLFTTGTCLGWTILTIGIRIFFTTYLFDKFPRLRRRFDTYGYFYRNLPLRSPRVVSTTSTTQSQPSTGRSARNGENDERGGEKFSSRLGSNFNLDQSAAVNLLLGPNHQTKHRNSLVSSPIAMSSSLDDSNPNLDDPIEREQATGEQQHGDRDSGSESVTVIDVAPSRTATVSSSGIGSDTTTSSMSRNNTYKSSSFEEDEQDDNEHMSFCADPIIENVIAFRSCVMNEREKIFPMGFTSGILYLTDAALVFRCRNTIDQKEQLMMLFHDVKHVKKVQSLRSMSLITGTRKSLEIYVEGRRKPIQFIGIAKRDDFVTRIQLMCRNAGAEVIFSE